MDQGIMGHAACCTLTLMHGFFTVMNCTPFPKHTVLNGIVAYAARH
jgi:hypothetical protein